MELTCRKNDHIELTKASQKSSHKSNLVYEPLLSSHQFNEDEIDFLGKKLKAPLWISSMTGGGSKGKGLNQVYARACKEHGIGLGLGSLRIAIEDEAYKEDFNVRHLIGQNLPLWGNLGIAQVEKYLEDESWNKVEDLWRELDLDGAFIHINPLQEWVQDEGDRLLKSPMKTLERLKKETKLPIMIKGVGQGIGPKSLKALADLNFLGIEFGAWGGTNFSILEASRKSHSVDLWKDLGRLGQSKDQMMNDIIDLKNLFSEETHLIISGGIRSLLDGVELLKRSPFPSVIGMAWPYLKAAEEGESILKETINEQIKIIQFLENFTEL